MRGLASLIDYSHSKADCTEPRVFKGECRICHEEGHPAAECPTKPPAKCYNCKEEGHDAKDCKKNRVFDNTGIEEATASEAWEKLLAADKAKDLDDIRHVCLLQPKAKLNS